MKYIILILALLFATPIFAQTAQNQTVSQELSNELANMSDAQKAEALKAIRASESPSAARAREWIDIGNGLGEGLAATAQKLGVVANDFAQSPVGQMAMFLIIWNYLGDDILDVIIIVPSLIVIFGLYLYQMRKIYGIYTDAGKFVKYDVHAIVDSDTSVPAIAMSTIVCIFMLIGFIVLIS